MTTIVRTLLGARDIETAQVCLRSLLRESVQPLALEIYDDGTLTEENAQVLDETLKPKAIINREVRDEIINEALASYPQCRSFRRENPLAMKLFDVVLTHSDRSVYYCDSDVFFLRRYRGLFDDRKDRAAACFMADRVSAYSITPWFLLGQAPLALPRRANSGIIICSREAFDLEFLEWILARPDVRTRFKKTACWAEQTCWALLGQRAGCSLLDPRQGQIIHPSTRFDDPDLVVLHFVRSYRGLLSSVLDRVNGSEPEAVSTLRFSPPAALGAASFAFDELRKRVAGF